MTVVLTATGLYRFYHSGGEETAALRGVDLTLDAGSFTAVMGPSGSGKSTLLACLAGLDDPDGGNVVVCGEKMSRQPEQRRALLRAQKVGILMQSGNLFDHLSVAGNMRLQQDLSGNDSEAKRRVLLERLGLMHRANALPSQLSGGESARAGLAVALASSPPLLICDEPTAEVDAAAEQDIIVLLGEQALGGVAVLVATHSEALANATARIVRLNDGKMLS